MNAQLHNTPLILTISPVPKLVKKSSKVNIAFIERISVKH